MCVREREGGRGRIIYGSQVIRTVTLMIIKAAKTREYVYVDSDSHRMEHVGNMQTYHSAAGP